MIGLPVKSVSMKCLRRIESQIIHILVLALTVSVVVELHLCSILAEDLYVDLVPRIVVGRACIREERRNYACILDRLHRSLIVAVVVEIIRSVLSTCIVILA